MRGDDGLVGACGDVAPARAVADDDQHVRRRKLRVERRPQRPGGHAAAVARAIVGVDCDERQVGRDPTAVKAVVENDHTCAEALRQSCAGDAIDADNRWRDARKQQRLVADVVAS